SWAGAAVVFGLIVAALAPVLVHTVTILRDAHSHVITGLPPFRTLIWTLKFGLVGGVLAGAWLLSNLFAWQRKSLPAASALVLIGGWWLMHPGGLFTYSWLSGNSVFVDRYLALGLPGVALAAMVAAALFVPTEFWKPIAAAFGVGVIFLAG